MKDETWEHRVVCCCDHQVAVSLAVALLVLLVVAFVLGFHGCPL
jgi:hypothetical protein